MLLKASRKSLGDPGKFLIPCNFPGMDVCHALPDLGASINLMPLSIWKKLSLPELTPTRMTLELADRSITHPKGLAEDIFVKVEFSFSYRLYCCQISKRSWFLSYLGRSFLRTSHALIDVYEGELVLRDGNEQITFHVNGTTKKHENESIKMVNDACKDSFKRFTDKPALVCLPPPEDVNNEKEKQEVKNLAELTVKRQTRITPCLKNFKVIFKESIFHSNKPPQVSSVFALPSHLSYLKPKDSLIMGDEHLSTFSIKKIVPILRESKETSRSDSKNDLPSCDDFSSINDYTIAITPVLSTKEAVDSLIMEDDHLDTIPATESDEVIKSSVENLFLIPSESKGISEDTCDMPVGEDSSTFDALSDHSEILSDSNNDGTLSDDDSYENIEYIEASPLNLEMDSLEEVNEVDQEEKEFDLEDIFQIQDVILHEKLLNISRLVTNIESLKDNPTLDRVLKSPSSFPIPVTDSNSFFEKSDTSLSHLDNSLPEFETFSDHTEEMRSVSTTTHANNSLPEYDSFLFEVEPD
ncbi:reverse transcriptase domain-containing protein [Tanacetum coccineum]